MKLKSNKENIMKLKSIEYVELADVCSMAGVNDISGMSWDIANSFNAGETEKYSYDTVLFIISAKDCIDTINDWYIDEPVDGPLPKDVINLTKELSKLPENTYINVFVDIDKEW